MTGEKTEEVVILEPEAAPEVAPEKPETPEPEVKEYKPRTKKRIDHLLTEREQMRKRAEAAEAELARMKKPTLEDLDHDIERFSEALVDYKATEIAVEQTRKQEKQSASDYQAQIVNEWSEIEKEATQKYPEFRQYFTNDVPVTQFMAEAILASNAPAEVALYLGKHREDAARIASLPAHMQTMEIARLEAVAKVLPKVTEAPPPPSVRLNGAGGVARKNYDEMSDAEFTAARRAERAEYLKNRY